MASQLPGARAAIADNQGLPTPEFYRFLLGLQRLSAGSATSADITALQTQITAIQSEIDGLPKSSFPTLQVAAPVYSQGLLQNGFAKIGVNVADSVIVNGTALQLDGDTAAPGNTYLYSTSLTGTKGWNALSSMLHQSANVAVTFGADGTATFDLAPLADSGAGTFKLITRDSYGRLAGTKAGTTSDVPEGTNLYFTASRVLATVLAGLSTATSVVITAADTVLSALGKLQAQISANVTTLAGKLTAANNLSDVANAATALANLGALALPDPGYINGLQMAWVSATQVTVSSGAAYIQSAGSILQVPATITINFSGLTASTWYHLYLYNNTGTAAIEYSTTAPASPYNGTARAKTGDTSRRYIGSVLTNSTSSVLGFSHRLKTGAVEWLASPSTASPFRVLSNGTSTAAVNVSIDAAAPSAFGVCGSALCIFSNLSNVAVAVAPSSTPLSNTNYRMRCEASNSNYCEIQMSGAAQMSYKLFSTPSSGGFYIDVIGFTFER